MEFFSGILPNPRVSTGVLETFWRRRGSPSRPQGVRAENRLTRENPASVPKSLCLSPTETAGTLPASHGRPRIQGQKVAAANHPADCARVLRRSEQQRRPDPGSAEIRQEESWQRIDEGARAQQLRRGFSGDVGPDIVGSLGHFPKRAPAAHRPPRRRPRGPRLPR